MGALAPRKDYVKSERAHGLLMHEVVIAVQQKNLDVIESTVLERSTPGHPSYQNWMTVKEVSKQSDYFYLILGVL